MRTTLEIPRELIEEARNILGFKSKTDTVVLALRELVGRKRLDDLKGMTGTIPNMVDARALDRKRAAMSFVDTSVAGRLLPRWERGDHDFARLQRQA